MAVPVVQILNNASFQPGEADTVVREVQAVLTVPVGLGSGVLNLDAVYDVSRRQYNSTALLAQILAWNASPNQKCIAVVDVDLYVPVLTFVFGEAQLDGSAAIVSTQRLHNQFYGMEENRERMLDRLVKEIIHELGHTFGLRHCRQFECVMRSSTYVEEIDLKRVEMCPSCRAILKEKKENLVRKVSVP